ncbi:helix-turn-helix transcriptional regulator [Lactobacillus jensenii]|uniref:helix-turn-helix domain-containing protein n=1 Tax=Lactobacillus jensenii TaxID=109790 RepID=UPI001193D994|nr:helix-turn-helix transcriptional regulator [Lactobacillus jensenii]MBS5831521.1 helix-turn-helix transcriptional regulator [Lactobacillus jensenii]MCW8081442.1 helix-turn-helix domain-containing protein [Lactobacillus jensenii]MCW8089307.1 helix-turn-helix domain-containing protein [Lactobacillus jensenii]MCZ9641794.1 helix-turn-helix domain-containing protein [Lactobacillus jensenii]MCZ9657212.1 helix-turn-helix domain-containing protein [Lactobacillus jensenii]
MTIGDALKKVRLERGLTQKQMCEGIVSRPFYVKVESNQTSISAESLAKILFLHEIDISSFYKLLKETYMPKENQMSEYLQNKMMFTFDRKDLQQLKEYCKQVHVLPGHKILKLRSIVSVAYLENKLEQIDQQTIKEIYEQFDEGKNWITRPELLRLLANTMPMWSQEHLDFLIGRLLAYIQKNKSISKIMIERYLRLLENYLGICYERKTYVTAQEKIKVEKTIKTILDLTENVFHFMIYRFFAIYFKCLIKGDYKSANHIQDMLKKYGYEKVVKSWSKINM